MQSISQRCGVMLYKAKLDELVCTMPKNIVRVCISIYSFLAFQDFLKCFIWI